jgi:hypothetical protein
MTSPVVGSHPHADGVHWLGSRAQRLPGPHWASDEQGGTKPTQKPPSAAPASTTPASRGSHTPPPQSAVQVMPLGPQAQALGRQTPADRTQASPRTQSVSAAQGGRNPRQAPPSVAPASGEGRPQMPPPQSSVQVMPPVAGSHKHTDGLHWFSSRKHARPGPHWASERQGGSKPAHWFAPPSASGRRWQMRPLQSFVHCAVPVAGSQGPQADGAQRRSTGGRHASVERQSKSERHGATTLAHRPAPASAAPPSRRPPSVAPASGARRGWQRFPSHTGGQVAPAGQFAVKQLPSSGSLHSDAASQSASVLHCSTGREPVTTGAQAATTTSGAMMRRK